MIRRRIVLIYWILALGFFSPGAVFAYIDPATTTYIIQIITALVVTVGVSLSIFMYRFRMISAKVRYGTYGLMYRFRNGKTKGTVPIVLPIALPARDDAIQSGYVITGAAQPPTEEEMAALGQPTGIEKILRKGADSEMPWEKGYAGRLKAAIPVSLAIALSFILIGCLDLAVQNSVDIPFRPGAIVPTLLLASGACFAGLVFIIPLFRGKMYPVFISLALALLIAGYIQGNFMNGALGELTGEAVYWEQFRAQTIAGLFIWALVFVAIFVLLRFAKPAWRGLLFFAPLLLLIVQAVALATVVDEYQKNSGVPFWHLSEETLTIEGLHNPASEKNAIIFVLDRLDGDFVRQIENNHPGFFDVLDGFTEFNDNISYNASTFPSVIGMLTGNRYAYDRPVREYIDDAWGNAEMIRALKERDVDIRIYIGSGGDAYDDIGQLKGIANNISIAQLGFNKRIALIKLLKLSAYRYAPMCVKQIFWIAPTEFGDTLEMLDEKSPYITNDFGFYENITTYGLTPSEAEMGFFYYHLLGAHGPLNMDENINWVEEQAATDYTPQRVRQATGCFKIVFEYLDQLRALGLYEDATIIITADHPDYRGDELDKPMHAALFVKPAGSAGTKLKVSDAPVCPDQLPGTIVEGLFGDRGGFAPGYMDVKEGADIVREYDVRLHRYRIEGDGRDFNNWKFLEELEGKWGTKER